MNARGCWTWGLLGLLGSIRPDAARAATFPPYAATDSRVLVDIGITALAPRNTWTALPPGFSLEQVSGRTPGVLDDVHGFTPNAGGTIGNYAAFPTVPSSQGTIYVRLQRAALSIDDSTDSGANFFDSTGNTTGGYGANAATAFTVFDGDNNLLQWLMSPQASTAQVLDGGNWVTLASRYDNSHSSSPLDGKNVEIILTWQGTTYWTYFDGVANGYGKIPEALPAVGQFTQITIGGYLGGAGSAGQPLGPYAIQRFQLSTAYSPPPSITGKPLIAFYGDSFVVQGAGVSGNVPGLPSATTIAAVDAVQAQMLPIQSPGAYAAAAVGQDGFVSLAEAYTRERFGGYTPLFTSAESGHGWAYTGMGGTTVNNTPAIDDFTLGKTVYSDALDAAQPEYIFGFGSVNDVNNGVPADIVGDTRAHFDYWANNNRNLKGIYYVETLSWELATGACLARGGPAGWVAEMKRQRLLLRAAFSGGYLAGTRQVPVTYIESYESWVKGTNSARYLIASNPDNHTQSANSGSAPNGHPDAEGNIQIVDAYVWPYLLPLLSANPGSSPATPISAAQSAVISPGTSVQLSITPAGAGPFRYQWYTGTSGNTTSPIVGADGPNFQTPKLEHSTSYWVQVIGVNGVPVNSTTITLAVAANSSGPGTSNVPFPLWAQILLGIGLISVAARVRGRQRQFPV
jgi:hypothetical protein